MAKHHQPKRRGRCWAAAAGVRDQLGRGTAPMLWSSLVALGLSVMVGAVAGGVLGSWIGGPTGTAVGYGVMVATMLLGTSIAPATAAMTVQVPWWLLEQWRTCMEEVQRLRDVGTDPGREQAAALTGEVLAVVRLARLSDDAAVRTECLGALEVVQGAATDSRAHQLHILREAAGAHRVPADAPTGAHRHARAALQAAQRSGSQTVHAEVRAGEQLLAELHGPDTDSPLAPDLLTPRHAAPPSPTQPKTPQPRVAPQARPVAGEEVR